MTCEIQLPTFLTSPDPFIYEGGNYVVLDFETTVLDKGSALNPKNSIVLAVWKLGPNHPRRLDGGADGSYQIEWAGEYDLERLVEHCRDADFIVAHNAKFELQWLERCGLDLADTLVWCTMVGEYVIGGNRWIGHNLSLEACAQRRYGEGKMNVISKMYKNGLCSTEIPASWLQKYCVRDVELCERLFIDQLQSQIELELLPVMYTRSLVTPVLADLEKNGMQVDPDLVRTRLDEIEGDFVKAEQELNDFTGGINLNSPKQVGAYLYTDLGFAEIMHRRGGRWQPIRTEGGQPKADADTIQLLKCTTAKQREFKEKYAAYKELYNELTKYLRKFDACAKENAGLLHAAFNQCNTQTHRLSSTGTKYSCQFQNFPRAYKPIFKARNKGWLVGECDGAQLEFRVAAHMGQDEVAKYDIEHDVDIHTVTASVIWPDMELLPSGKHPMRQEAKPHTFKPTYGGQSGTEDEMRYYKFFREKYYDLTATQQRWIDEVLENKQLVTEWGMRYYWPHVKMDKSGYVKYSTNISNYPIQAFATAEIIPIALVYFWHKARRAGAQMFIVNTVHDSIIVELPPDEIELFHRLSKECLIDDVYTYLNDVYGVQLSVPLGAGVKAGSNWNGADCGSYVPEGLDHDKGEVIYTAEKSLYSL